MMPRMRITRILGEPLPIMLARFVEMAESAMGLPKQLAQAAMATDEAQALLTLLDGLGRPTGGQIQDRKILARIRKCWRPRNERRVNRLRFSILSTLLVLHANVVGRVEMTRVQGKTPAEVLVGFIKSTTLRQRGPKVVLDVCRARP